MGTPPRNNADRWAHRPGDEVVDVMREVKALAVATGDRAYHFVDCHDGSCLGVWSDGRRVFLKPYANAIRG